MLPSCHVAVIQNLQTRFSVFRVAPGLIAAAVVMAVQSVAPAVHAQQPWYNGFEGPDASWRDAGGDAAYEIRQHARVRGEAHTGANCERLTVVGNHGTYVYVSHEVGRPRVIDELLPTIWVKSDRPGLQVLAQVILPRTPDPRTGRPVSTIVGGTSYANVNHWQQLRIDDTPTLLARQIRVLRTQMGPGVDGREAYVDRVLLNVYGGPGTTTVWIDDLDIAGYVAAPTDAGTAAVPTGPTAPGGPSGLVHPGTVGISERRRVELIGSVLTVEGRPMFPRAVRHQGEPLAFLEKLGFNAVWLDRPASAEILAEASRTGMWLICPPPRPTSPYLPADQAVAPEEIGPPYDPVLVWQMGSGLPGSQLDATGRQADEVRLADRQKRPLICQAEDDLRSYSRHVDLLLIDRRPLGTSLELADFGNWLCRQPRLARPGTPIWTTIQTQPRAALREQLAALGPDRPPPLTIPEEQIRLLVYTAVASGSRGLVFDSQSPLNAEDPDSRQRAMALELLNLELRLIEPWAAAGGFVTAVSGNRPEVAGSLLRTDRARLLLSIWSAPAAQYVLGPSAANDVSLLVPGVPEASSVYVYELGPGGLRPLRHKRDTGGVRVTLEDFGPTGLVLFAQDPLFVHSLTQRSNEIGPRAAELNRHLAAGKLHAVQSLVGQLAPGGVDPRQAAGWIEAAQKSLRWCDAYLAAGDYQAACRHAGGATRSLRAVERAYWEAAVRNLGSPVAGPTTACFAALPWHRGLIDRIAGSRTGPNRLVGGDFEDLQTILGAGWRHVQRASDEVRTSADLLAGAAHTGSGGLRLTARAADPENPPAVLESTPLSITSPAVPVEAGELVRIQGWVQVPAAITGSVDGLMVVDSLSGEALAERIGQTDGWRQFTLYRVALRSGHMNVTFSLTGLGEVWLDDVTIQPLHPVVPANMTRRPYPGYFPR